MLAALLTAMLTSCSGTSEGEQKGEPSQEASITEEATQEPTTQAPTTDPEEPVAEELKSLLSEPIQNEVSGWTITLEDCMIGAELKNVSTVLGYAAAEISEFSKSASEGKEFFLVKMKFVKGKSNDTIDWEKLEVVDSEGNRSVRVEDAFVEELGLKRMPGTILNFGSSEGWLVFEIEKGSRELSLEYPFTDATYQQAVTLNQ